MTPSSLIQTPFGMLMTPKSDAITWSTSTSDGCSGAAASINGRHASVPRTSRPTVTISRPSGWSSFRKACHTGRSPEQPQYGAQETMRTFCPRSDDKENILPFTSGNCNSGATALGNVCPESDAGPSAHTPE